MRTILRAGALVLTVATAAVAQTDRNHDLAREHLRAGQAAMEVEKWDVAEREFQSAIELDPRLELAHYGLGQVFMATKRYTKAVDAFVSCRNVFVGNVAEGQAQRLTVEQRIEEQLASLRDQRRSLESGRVRSRNLSDSIRRVDDQIRQLERMRHRQLDPSQATPPYILTALGSAYFRSGSFPDAEREWRLAADLDPSIGEVHNNLAVVYMLTGRLDDAAKEIGLAEKNGFKVSPGLKDDLKKRKAGKTGA